MPSLPYLDRGLRRPQQTAIVDSQGSWSYGELGERTQAVAGRLGGLRGERVGLFLDRTREAAALVLGVLQAGGVAVPLSLRATPREHAYQLLDAGISKVVVDPAFEAVLRETLAESGPKGGTPEVIRAAALLAGSGAPDFAPPAPEAPAVILYTSGTTGQPKGVVHTHASLAHQADVLFKAWEWGSEDRLLHVLPLHHVHGLINGLLGALWAGAEVGFRKSFQPEEVWELMASREATVFYAVPTLYHHLIESWGRAEPGTQRSWAAGAGALRLAVSGSAALPTGLWTRWREITGQALLERYGMTEVGMALSNPYAGERRAGTVGQALPGMDVRIVAENGVDAPEGTPGEIWVRGGSLFKEYWNRPEATRESFRDGYFLTGDVAEWDRGYVRIRGRASVDIIKSAAYKISALEVEGVLLEHAAIREAAVVGQPDPEWGEVVTAFVTLHPGQSVTIEGLREFCRDKLASYKIPRRLRVLENLPRNAMGKVTKPALLG
jgi:malonyl-CoA/methylmalonyl-CoA synthetase